MKLRVVRIPKEFKKYNYSFYYNFIKSYKDSLFQIDNKSLLALLNIDSNNIVLSFYVIYQILISNDLSPIYRFYSYYLHNLPYFKIKEGISNNYNGRMAYYLIKN